MSGGSISTHMHELRLGGNMRHVLQAYAILSSACDVIRYCSGLKEYTYIQP